MTRYSTKAIREAREEIEDKIKDTELEIQELFDSLVSSNLEENDEIFGLIMDSLKKSYNHIGDYMNIVIEKEAER